MSIQTTSSLPIQPPGTQPQGPRLNVSLPNEGANFGATFGTTLTRQIEQRQIEQRQLDQRHVAPNRPQPQPQPALAPPLVAGPKPQVAKPAANEGKAPAREAVKEPARESAHSADAAGAAGKADAAKAQDGTGKTASDAKPEDEAGAAGAKGAADSVTDMLALMASVHQLHAGVAAPAQADVAAQAGEQLTGLPGQGGDGTDPLAKLGKDPALEAGTGGAQQKAEPGIDLRALELGKAGEAAKHSADTGAFAAKLQESAARDVQPGAQALNSLATQANALQGAQAAGSVPTDRLSARVGTPAWDTQVGQKIVWMVGGEDQSATLELNPPDLGPVQVVLNVSNDMASVTFSAQQLEVRQALENALPRLREMMNDSGIALGNASVNAGNEGRQGQDGRGTGRPGSGGGNGNGGGDGTALDGVPRQRTAILGGTGAVDTFA